MSGGNGPSGRDLHGARRGGRLAVVIVLIVTTVACAIGAALLMTGQLSTTEPKAPSASGLTDMNGNPVELDPDEELPPPDGAETAGPAEFGRFSIAAVGLNVPLRGMNAIDGVVTPPGFTSAYVLRNYGADLADAGSGTVYIAMHSMRGGAVGPGNYLFNVTAGTSRVEAGDLIQAGPRSYRVTDSMNITKSELPEAQSIWTQPPGTLVVITCLQTPAGTPSTSNFIITATLVS